jgi:hypothetical protein
VVFEIDGEYSECKFSRSAQTMSDEDRFLSDALRRAAVAQSELVTELELQRDFGGYQVKNLSVGGFFEELAFVVRLQFLICF